MQLQYGIIKDWGIIGGSNFCSPIALISPTTIISYPNAVVKGSGRNFPPKFRGTPGGVAQLQLPSTRPAELWIRYANRCSHERMFVFKGERMFVIKCLIPLTTIIYKKNTFVKCFLLFFKNFFFYHIIKQFLLFLIF